MEKKKLYLITQNYPYGTGERTFIEPEIDILDKSDRFDITIISNAPKGDLCKKKSWKNVKYEWIPCRFLFSNLFLTAKYVLQYFVSKENRMEKNEILRETGKPGKLMDSLFFYVRAQLFYHDLRKSKISLEDSIVYTYWCDVQTLAIALHKKKIEEIKLVSRIHGFDLYDDYFAYGRKPFRRYIDEKLDRLFFIAQVGMDHYVDKLGKSNRYVLCRLGILSDYSLNEVKKQQKGEVFRLLSCSSIIPLKRIEFIIQALGEIDDVEIEWIHFGDGPMRQQMEKLAQELMGNKSNIHYEFKGHRENKEVVSFYQNNYVDCFITTSQTEGCPVSLQEAMSCGIPLIGTSVGEIPIMIEGNGILLSANPEIGEIVQAIKELFNKSEIDRMKMRETSRQLWENYFNGEVNHSCFVRELVEL